MTITRLELHRFTAFETLDFRPSRGVNVLVGANGTGKTHLMKVAYAACDVSKTGASFPDKLTRVFMPSGRSIGRLVKRRGESSYCTVTVSRDGSRLRTTFSNHAKRPDSVAVSGTSRWNATPVESVYIPVKEMLANAPGFRSLYSQREIHFEEICDDILARAYKPILRGPMDGERRRLLDRLQEAMAGEVTVKNEEFFLSNREGSLEFTLLAEGIRKLGLLWLLIRNGTLPDGSVLFWDEPETNLNPKLFRPLIGVLLELQRMGVQIFIATHDYAILKELDLQWREGDQLAFHSLHREPESGEIACNKVRTYLEIHPNAIADAFTDLYDREVERSLARHPHFLVERV